MADELLSGTLTLVEFESSPEKRILYSESGFPVCSVRTRYFWLCQKCSRLFKIRGWNSAGVVLEPFPTADPGTPLPWERKRVSPETSDTLDPPERYYGTA